MISYAGRKVLITGGLGLIGSQLARTLVCYGAEVTLLDNLCPYGGGNTRNISDIRDKVDVEICDIRDAGSMEAHLKGKDFLFSLAAQTSHSRSMSEPIEDLTANAVGQLVTLEAARSVNRDVRIIFASTRQVYGKAKSLPVRENHPLQPVDINGIHKLAAEWYHLLYGEVHAIRSCVLRLTNTYGPGMRIRDGRQNFLGQWIRQLLEDRPIQVFGDGRQMRDMNFVDDCVGALLLAGASNASDGRIFNLGSHVANTLEDLAQMMCEIYGTGRYELVPFPQERQAIDIGSYQGDITLIGSMLGWSPQVSVRDGLVRTIEYFMGHAEYYL